MSFNEFVSHFGDTDHLVYFLIGVVLSGTVLGIAGYFHSRFVLKTLPRVMLTMGKDEDQKS